MQLNDFTSMQIDGQEITELQIDNTLVWSKPQNDNSVEFITSDIINWETQTSGSDSFKISNYTIPLDNYEMIVEINSSDVQIGVGGKDNWLWAMNMGKGQNQFFTHKSSGESDALSVVTNWVGAIMIVRVEGTTISLYRDDYLITQKTNRKVTGYSNTIRIYTSSDASKIKSIKIKPL